MASEAAISAAAEAGMTVVVVDGEEPSWAEEGEDSRQWAELKWSSREEESGAVKSQRRQRQQAWTRLRRERRVTLADGCVEWTSIRRPGVSFINVAETGRKCVYASFTANVVYLRRWRIYKKKSMQKRVRSSTHPFTLE